MGARDGSAAGRRIIGFNALRSPLSDAPLANGVGVVPGSDPPVVLLVVDDSADDELVSIFAREDMVPAPDYGGGWSSSLTSGIVRFTLERVSGGFRRDWRLPGLTAEIAGATSVAHLVALAPAELAGDRQHFTVEDLHRFRGGLIVAAHPTIALTTLVGADS